MAKTKDRSFNSKVIRRIKRQLGVHWNSRQLLLYEKLLQEKDVPLDNFSGSSSVSRVSALVAGCMLSYLDDCALRKVCEAFLAADDIDAFIYPGLIGLWQKMPRVLSLNADVVQAILSEDDYGNVPLANLERLFPSCLLIDLRPLKWCDFDAKVEYAFVYPVFDEDGSRVILQYVVGGPKGWGYTAESKLQLEGATFADARAFSNTDRERRWAFQMSGLNYGDPEFSYHFDPLLDDPETGEKIDRVLSIVCSSTVELEEGVDGKVPMLTAAILNDEPIDVRIEDDADNEIAEPVAPADDDSIEINDVQIDNRIPADTRDSDLPDSQDACAAETPEQKVPAEKTDAELQAADLMQKLEELQAEYDAYRRQSEAERSSITHNLNLLQSQDASLRTENAALLVRANFAEMLTIPHTALEAVQLAQQAFPDRLLILAQASKTAEKYTGDVAEVWDVLRCMATVLYPLIFEQTRGHLSQLFQSQCGYECTLRDVHHTKKNAKFAQLREVSYKGQVRDMTAHVKGKSNRPGETLRVHFFADYDERKIVIGHCGEHLKTIRSSSL